MKLWGEDWVLTVYRTLWDVVSLGGLVVLKGMTTNNGGLRWMVVLVGVGLESPWLECVNDEMRKFGLKKRNRTR